MAVRQAKLLGVTNFALLVAHVLVPPAIMAILVSPGNRVQGFLAPGHVCAIQGWREYEPIARDFGVPLVVTGFEPVDLLEGIRMLVRQLEEGRAEVENQYVRAVQRDGNPAALAVVDEVFEVARPRLARHRRDPRERPAAARAVRDARRRDGSSRTRAASPASESEICIAGDVLRGRAKPHDCPAFGTLCTPGDRRSARRWSRPRAPAPHTSWRAGPGRGRRRERRRGAGGQGVRDALSGAAAAGRLGAPRPRQRRQAHAAADPRPVRPGAGRRPRARAHGRRGRPAAPRRAHGWRSRRTRSSSRRRSSRARTSASWP